MRIAGKLGISFAALTLLLIVAAGAGIAVASASRSTSADAQRYLTATRELKQFQLDGESVAVCENSIGFDYNSHSDATDDLDHLKVAAAAFVHDSLLVGRLPLTASQRATLQHAQQVFTVYIAQSRQANADFSKPNGAGLKAGNDLINNLAYVGVTAGLDRLSLSFSTNIDQRVAASLSSISRAREVVGALGAVGVLCAILLSILITRSIVRPLRSTVHVLDAVANGDLTQSLAVTSKDEVAQMGHALNRTVGLLRHAMAELTVLAQTDPLTGLANRAAFSAALAASLEDDANQCSSVLFIDVDDFKYVNDSLGHHGGDTVLVALARRLTQALRPDDLCARLGGDEFAVLLRHADSRTAQAVAHRIVASTGLPISVGDETVTVGVSIGLASEIGRSDIDEVVQHADVAMYTAKARGKGQLQVYSPDLQPTETPDTSEAQVTSSAFSHG